jgi:DNA repair exonuclease SbcCD ATPase subunit
MHTTPQAALATLHREVEALAEDSGRAGAMLTQRLDALLELLPAIGAEAQRPEHAGERAAVAARLEGLQAAAQRLEETLQRQLREVGAELAQLNTAREAAAGYARPRAAGHAPQLDRVG